MTDEQQIYQDFNFDDLQILSDYLTKNSVPLGMSIVEAQGIINIYADLINISLHNLNQLRKMAGDPEFPIPTTSVKEKGE